MKTQPLAPSRPGLLILGFGLLSAPLQQALAVDGTWTGATTNLAPTANWTNTANWAGGTLASGTDATATFVFNPISDGGGVGALAGGLIFDAPQTVGNFVFEDTDGFGSATIGLNMVTTSPLTPLNLTLDTTTGTPTITTGFLLTGLSGQKKAVINANLLGNDGLTTNGPGFLGLRGSLGTSGTTTSTISGALNVDGGILQIQSQLGSITSTTIRNGATLFLDFSTSGVSGTNRINAASTLTLGGAGGSGVMVNNNVAASTHLQTFNGVTLNAGAHQIILNNSATQTFNYNLGTIVNNGKAALNFSKPTAAGIGGINIANANTPQGIIGGWATFGGNNFAMNTGGAAAAYTTYVTDTWGTSNNTNISKNANLTAATTYSLRYDNGTATTLQLTGTNTIASGGVISAQQSPLITGGKITSGTADFNTHVNGGILRIASEITDNGAGAVTLVKSLGGTLQLENDMSYTGGTVVGAGTLIVGKGPSGGATGSLGSGAVILSTNNTSTTAYTPAGALAFNRSGTYTVTNAINPTVNGGGYLAQVANGGTLILNRTANIGGFIQQAGTTRLDFSAAGAPVKEILNGDFTTGPTTIHTARLTGRNGTLELLGGTGAANVQSFALTDVFGSVNLKLTPGSGGTTALNLGVLNRLVNDNNGGGTLAFTLPAGASATTTYGTANTLISDTGAAFVTINGNEWGAKDSTNTQIVAGSTIGGFYTATAGTGITAATNTDVTVNDTVTGAIQTNSLRFNTNAATTITVNAGGTLRPGGILVSQAVGSNVTTIGGTGDLRSNTGNRDLTIFQNNTRANLTIAAPIVNFDAGTNLTHLVKAGAGEVELTSAVNTYTGRTFLSEGTLRLSGSGQIGTTTTRSGSIFGRGGELILQDNAKIITGSFASFGQRQGENGTLTLKNSAIFDISADFNIGDVNAKGTLNISDSASVVTKTLFVGKGGYSEGIVNQTGGTLIAGNTPTGEWNLGGNTAGDTAATGTYNISGGTLNLLGQSFQTGRWGTGTMNISGSGAVTGNGWNVIGRLHTGVGTVNISGGTYNANQGGTGQAFMIVGEEGTGTLNVSGTGIVTAKSLSLAHAGGGGTVNQTGGTVDLVATTANAGVVFGNTPTPGRLVADYSGTYNLSGGLLKTFGIRENPTIVTPVASTFNFNGGTVMAIANNPTFMDNLDLAAVQAGGALIDTNSFDITIAQKLTHDLALGVTPDGGLTKSSGGTLTLSGTNTYTGPTAVSSGTLLVNGDNSAATGNITVASGAILGGSGKLGGALTVNGGFTPGTSPNTLTTTSSATFATGSTLTYELNGGDQTVGGGINDLFTGVTTLTLNGTLNIVETVPASFSLVTSGSWRLINYSGSLSGGGLTIGAQPTLPSGYSFAVDTSTTGQVNLTVVPEPAITGLLGGLLALVGFRRRRAA